MKNPVPQQAITDEEENHGWHMQTNDRIIIDDIVILCGESKRMDNSPKDWKPQPNFLALFWDGNKFHQEHATWVTLEEAILHGLLMRNSENGFNHNAVAVPLICKLLK